MKLIVVSPASEDAREPAVLAPLFAAGLTDYHLRKPGWGRDTLAAFLGRVPVEFHSRIVLHTHHELAAAFAVGGLHERDQTPLGLAPDASRQCQLSVDIPAWPEAGPAAESYRGPTSLRGGDSRPWLRSRAAHDLATLGTALGSCDRVLYSPVFPSLSKSGYGPDPHVAVSELRAVLALPRRAEAIALGGVDVSRVPACRDLGFDGVAVLGAIWQAADPVRAFGELQDALFSHAA